MPSGVGRSVTNEQRAAFGIDEASALYGVSPSFLRLEIRRGNLKSIRMGRRRLITTKALAEYIEAQAE